jgi:hypothetical protein
VIDFLPVSRYSLKPPALKRILISDVLAFGLLAFCQTNLKADEGSYWGTVLRNLAATYVVRMDDGKLLDAEWNSGYDDWSAGDRVILTTESGEGFMFYGDKRTQVDVFPYNPSEIGDYASRHSNHSSPTYAPGLPGAYVVSAQKVLPVRKGVGDKSHLQCISVRF